MRFGEQLVAEKLIGGDIISDAVHTQKYRPIKIGRLLRDLGHLKQGDLNRSLFSHLHPTVLEGVSEQAERLKERRFPIDVMEWANSVGVLPFELTPSRLKLVSTTFRDEVIESGEVLWKKECELSLVDESAYRFLSGFLKGAKEPERPRLTIVERATDDQKIAKPDPYTALFRDAILAAKGRQASDIHIEPARDGIDIRFRIFGDLFTWKVLSIEHRQSFINEVKRLTNLSVAVSGRAQDGRVSFRNWKLDIRVSLLPSQYGESIVLRLLDMTREFKLEKAGFDAEVMLALTAALRAKNGVVIISGPTGSGKTTTLYTLLASLDRRTKKIITLEDPIEYGIDGITQVQVNSKLGFSDALRSVLRQDPDVILVGEVRDSETADLCTKAALTGHLVLSTLHANGAAEVVSRFLNLGIEPFILKSCLRFSSAQRLIKQLCPHCSIPLKGEELKRLNADMAARELELEEGKRWKRRGLDKCSGCEGGAIGRLPLLEYMRSHEVQDYLAQGEGGKPSLGISLSQAALRLAERGEVDVKDALEMQ